MGQLAAGVAHEIRNPLTAIRSTMQYLLRGLDPEEPRHGLVHELLREVDRINSTVGGLLSLSRSGELRQSDIDLLEPLGQAVRLLQARAAEQGVEIRCDLGVGELRVLGDADQLEQVFLNLLINALQSMPAGGRIAVGAAPWPRNEPAGTRVGPGADRGHRSGDPAGAVAAGLRSVLHHQAGRHRPGAGDLPRHHRAAPG